jgi:mercuric ion transport protein
LAGLGATVASTLSFLPWLVTLSRHKQWTFAVSGLLIAMSFLNMYYVAPRMKAKGCPPDDPSACETASKFSKVLLWVSAALYLVGFFSAYLLGSILTKLDNWQRCRQLLCSHLTGNLVQASTLPITA